jgi:hypothetical protein
LLDQRRTQTGKVVPGLTDPKRWRRRRIAAAAQSGYDGGGPNPSGYERRRSSVALGKVATA